MDFQGLDPENDFVLGSRPSGVDDDPWTKLDFAMNFSKTTKGESGGFGEGHDEF